MPLVELLRQSFPTLILPGSRLVVGVSGGADSLALLHALRQLDQWRLHAATLDHGLRGAAGAADARFVEQLCASWDIPVTVGTLPPGHLPAGSGVEAAARAARYDFLAQVAEAVGAQFVAVGHHADDQAETVFMHILRGAGLSGLAGMPDRAPLPGHPTLTLLRPLLAISRREITHYCQQHGLQPRQDATNADVTLLRNRIRLEILPLLRQANPRIDDALVRLAAAAARDDAYLTAQLQAAISPVAQIDALRIRLPQAVFAALHPALQHRFVLWAAQHIGGPDSSSYAHIAAAVELAQRGRVGQQALLPGGLRLRLDYAAVVIEHTDAPPDFTGPLLPPSTHLRVTVPGSTPIPGTTWQLIASASPPMDETRPAARLAIQPSQIVELRTRQPGDRFAPPGLGGHHQSVKKWMIDHKIPQAARAQIPLLTVDGTITALHIGLHWVISDDQPTDSWSHYFYFAEREL
jgi:tRNA(Ile)-lysidine synthase